MTDESPPSASNAPPSPCINVCTLDAQGLCVGCLRTGDEIGRWLSMTPDEKHRLLRTLAMRRTLRSNRPS